MPNNEVPDRPQHTPHDEAFKKLLQTFFADFLELFFPEVNRLLDHSRTKLLMQELLVDIVGEERRSLDLLLETRYKSLDAYVLVHLEAQSYRETDFHERMFIYFSRLFERHRKEHKLIIPIAIFTSDSIRDEQDQLSMEIPGHTILHFHFLKLELRKQNWRLFIDSENPIAAALLSKMGYNEEERRSVRLEYLRMILKLQKSLDQARLSLIMSVADLYFKPEIEQDLSILRELSLQYPEDEVTIMELMPAWKRWGYEEGKEQGKEIGKELGKEEGKEEIIRKLLANGFHPDKLAEMLNLPPQEIQKLNKS